MIREIRGTILGIETDSLIVDVAGWGVLVSVPSSDTFSLGSTVSLKTYLSLKQDGVDLYGFTTEAERAFFELLLSVSGVGPKTALSILRRGPQESLQEAISARDIMYLTRVIGLSKKVAEKLCVELSEKIPGNGETRGDTDGEVFDTLVALGYTEREARTALAGIPKDIVEKDARLKAALSAK
ncbi:Holliday junction branch migration protein RuvA [Patescibacteria group bacterium]|nr:Holliday junction branch migration protein RuvA [Patescibacteria group bacterium]MBU1500603.1 Holliday junction branch migration protein RuvA [Patescibacteria group bacterium]MBU2080356.1 Holliday junction branch migration protein RuvA [Patescibacteria group bacterium]MBU2124232.1 Holliday junction branch migration protein RuvA [Patescibacteria group bacterium]MBU2194317.1 Holliday junction branch migration protein RuvA [Patescibacteria group bacterium]